MAPQELLLMLVLNVLYDKETPDVVDNRVFVLWVIIYSLLILSVVTDRMLEL